MRLHQCPHCPHQVRHDGELDGPVEHLPDGRHSYSVTTKVGYSLDNVARALATDHGPELSSGELVPA